MYLPNKIPSKQLGSYVVFVNRSHQQLPIVWGYLYISTSISISVSYIIGTYHTTTTSYIYIISSQVNT